MIKRLFVYGLCLVCSASIFSYALNRNFAENADVMAMELENYTLVEDPVDLIEADSELAWIYMQGVLLSEPEQPIVRSYERQGYEKYYTLNPETIGYINIQNSRVDYPILCHSDNNYYLDYNVYGEKDANGAIYLDAYSNGEWGNINLVHGHSMRNGSMFRDVLSYIQQDWYEEHKYINIFDGEQDRVYEVFSVYILDATKEAVPIYYQNQEDYQIWLQDVVDRSLVSGGTLHDSGDLLVLNTCSYQFSGAHTIVVASRVG